MDKNTYEVRDAVKGDIDFIAARMRMEDVIELEAGTGRSPYGALNLSFKMTPRPRTGVVNGEPIAMWGAAKRSLLSHKASVWLLGTDGVTQFKRAFLKHTPAELDAILQEFPYIENWVLATNRRSLRWLKWLGFNIDEPEAMGIEGQDFRRIWMERKDV